MADTTLVGNLVRDPELKFTPSGRPVAKGGIAVNRRWQTNGEWQEQVSFFNFVVWGDSAERAAESFVKGDRVVVVGRLEQRTWEKDDGTKVNQVEIVADELAASTRFATVAITKAERTNNDGTHTSNPGPSQRKTQAAAEDLYGEEPF